MAEKFFNLLHEPWIVVMKADGASEEVGLLELFRRAPGLRGLAGELPVQDMAILRLLLAILHAVLARYDLAGNEAPLYSANSPSATPVLALRRWKALWDRGELPMEIIEKYLRQYEERFYLFHPQYPFYQVPDIGKATYYSAAKLNGELSESGNKLRLFPTRSGPGKAFLSYGEAARWLLYVNGFDDTSAKPTQKGLPSPGAGWLGRLGLVCAAGDNLWATLLLNLVLLKDGENKLWEEGKPVWEEPEVRRQERQEIVVPNNPCALLTLHSRRLFLERHKDGVSGYYLVGGDFFSKEEYNIFAEQMTVWQNRAKNANEPPAFAPKRHNPARQMWRDFAALLAAGDRGRPPGIVKWLARLQDEDLLTAAQFRLQIAAVKYGDKDFFIDDAFSDSLAFNAALLGRLGADWINRIVDEIEDTDKLVGQVGWLAQKLAKAAGAADDSSQRDAAREQAYFRLDQPFREWLEKIDPQTDEMHACCEQWWQEAKKIVREAGRELIEQAGPQAFVGRTVTKNDKEQRYSAPEAYNDFMNRTSSREALNYRKDKARQ